jgi:hypothetical protein
VTRPEALLRRFTVAVVCAFVVVVCLYLMMWIFRLMDAMR